jgi:hypothetical protein
VKQHLLRHEFVEYLPEQLMEGTLYVSMQYATAAHKCCCGCGNDVFTPLSPTDWKLTFDGRTISLYPSIGNWSFPCRSHYWIRAGKVEWTRQWSAEEIADGRASDTRRKEKQHGAAKSAPEKRPTDTFWRKLKKWL